MPLVSVFNLRREDRLLELEEATRLALTSMPELAINDYEIDLVPVLTPDDFDGEVTTEVPFVLGRPTDLVAPDLSAVADAILGVDEPAR
jgi:hypothetical protein